MPRRQLILVIAAIAVAATIAYLPSLRGGFIWDDDAHVTNNIALRSLGGLIDIWIRPGAAPQYYPMAHTGFWIQFQLFGENPLGYKIVNLALHITTSSLLLLVLLRLGLAPWTGALAACVFALHPVHVESVAWITELKNTLSGAFYFASALAYLHSLDRNDRRWYWMSLALFVAALLAKSVTASLPAALLLVLWWKRERLRWSDVKPLVPFFIVGAAMGLFTVWFERHMVGAKGEDFGFTFADRLLIAGRAVWFYAGKIVWPHPLVFTYPRWTIDTGAWWQWLFPIAAAVLVVILLLSRKRLGLGPLVAALFFGGTLLPAIGFLDVYPFVFSFVADHFQYLASVGLIVLIVGAAAQLTARVPQARFAVIFACVVALVALGAKTFAQGFVYRDLQTLYRHVLTHNPASWMAHNNLGGVLRDQHRYDEAVSHFERSLELNPINAGAMRNLAAMRLREGRDDEALQLYERALQLRPDDTMATVALGELYLRRNNRKQARTLFTDAAQRTPRNLLAWYNLGLMAMADGDAPQAVEALRRTVAIQDDLSEAHYQLAHALLSLGEPDQAANHFRKALAISGDNPKAMLGLGNALAAAGDDTGAIEQFRNAAKADPALPEAHYNLGIMHRLRGQSDEAMASLRQAIALDADFADAHFELANVLMQLGQLDDAARHYEAAITAKPTFAEAHNNLGVVRTAQDRADEAVAAHRKALEIRPEYTDARLNLGIALVELELYDEAANVLEPLTRNAQPSIAAAYQHGIALAAMQRLDAAAAMLAKAVQLQPGHVDAMLLLADIQLRLNRRTEARQLFADLLKHKPDAAVALRSLAWLTVTDPAYDPLVNPMVTLEALKLADRANRLTGGDDPRSLDVLAAAAAAAGRFSEAIRQAQLGESIARDKGDIALASAIAQRLDVYRAGKRWTE